MLTNAQMWIVSEAHMQTQTRCVNLLILLVKEGSHRWVILEGACKGHVLGTLH